MLVAVAVVLAIVGAVSLTQFGDGIRIHWGLDATDRKPRDSDHDGLPDTVEKSGWTTAAGVSYKTDPHLADTDGDGLTDGDEAGAPGGDAATYAGYSNPLVADDDDDGLSDSAEADLSLNPSNADSDGDGLSDGAEANELGTAPDVPDTDTDGFDDGYEAHHESDQGLDPLVVDVKVSKLSYVTDVAKGAVLGDLDREDSLAWLAGNLASGGSSLIPGIGWIVGGISDVRDAIGSAIHADWVGSGFSVVGVLPDVGDAVAIPGKVAKFVARNPELAAGVAALIVALNKVPDAIKVKAARAIWKNWDDLRDAGASEKALLQLERGRTNLDDLGAAIKRSSHVDGPAARFFGTGYDGEKFLEGLYGVSAEVQGATKQVVASTKGCIDVCNLFVRRFDVVADGIAHESKVGFVRLTPSVEKQIRSDAWLVKNGTIEGAHWHFFASSLSNSLGADKRVLDLLDELGIPYTIHIPA